jgi:dihydrofolate reductase
MRRVILYITASIDGFIAETGGGMGWLDEASATGSDFGYADFYRSVETMLMGSATYEFVLGAADPFPHSDREVFVFTSRDLPIGADSVTLVGDDPAQFVSRLRQMDGGPIWLVGGGMLNSAMLDADLIDEVRLFVQPVLLGDGVPLFAGAHAGLRLELVESATWAGGVVELRYRRRDT